MRTDEPDYAARLLQRETRGWKRLLHVQAPYAWNIRRISPGFTLDIGCGIGRNLLHLHGRGVGVDHNTTCIEVARRRGLTAFTPDEFAESQYAPPYRFDVMLLAHVLEHLSADEADSLFARYLPSIRANGTIICITPQEAGYASDPTHKRFVDFKILGELARTAGLSLVRQYSFPFPRWAGRFFLYNEFVWIGRLSSPDR